MRYRIGALITLVIAYWAITPARADDMTIALFEQNISAGGRAAIEARWFIGGIESGLSWANAALEVYGRPKLYCEPGKVALTDDQMIDILRRAVQSHRVDTGSRLAPTLLLAFQEAFPCR